jgi:hypothetical protein
VRPEFRKAVYIALGLGVLVFVASVPPVSYILRAWRIRAFEEDGRIASKRPLLKDIQTSISVASRIVYYRMDVAGGRYYTWEQGDATTRRNLTTYFDSAYPVIQGGTESMGFMLYDSRGKLLLEYQGEWTRSGLVEFPSTTPWPISPVPPPTATVAPFGS